MDLETEVTLQDVLAEKSLFLRLLDGFEHAGLRQAIFTADIDVAFAGAHGITGDESWLR